MIKDLKIKRGKEKPFTFQYELELIGIADREHHFDPLFGGGFQKFMNGCQKALEAVQKVYEVTEALTDALDTFADGLVAAKKYFEAVKHAKGAGIAGLVFDKPLRMATGGSNNSVYNSCKALMGTAGKIRYLAGTTDTAKTSAHYSRDDVFVVSFNTGSGSYVPFQKIAYGNKAVKPADPVLPKFAFKGWYTDDIFQTAFDFDSTEITKNMTLYAQWRQTQATVTFNSRQGTPVNPETVDIGEKAALPEPPSRNGYTFEYWCVDAAADDAFDFTTPITGDITLYARWKTVYTAAFYANGGSDVDSQIINVGGKVIYPVTPVRDHYLFVMWCKDSGLASEYHFDSPVNGNINLYAKWTRISNAVTFESNGGSEVLRQTVDIGSYAARPDNPVKEGALFYRWCVDAALTAEFDFSTPITGDITLYAAWHEGGHND